MNTFSNRDLFRGKIAVVCSADLTFNFLLMPQMIAAKSAGHTVCGVSTEGKYFRSLRDKGFSMFPVTIKRSVNPFSDLAALWKMYRYFKCERFDIVHTHTPKAGLLGQLAAKLAGVPIIVNTVHGFYFHENMNPLVRRFYIAMEWIAAKCSTIIFSQNPEDIETAVRLGICKRGKIRLLGNGVDLSKFEPSRFDGDFKRRKRTEIGVPEGAIIVGIVGRLVREKGHFELYEAMRDVMTENEKVWLIIVAYKEPEKADRISTETFKQFGIEKRTIWVDGHNDIPELLCCFDIFTLPSWREGFPRSAIEAAAMALPIVATDIRGCRQVVDDGVTGLLVPLGDSGTLASAIKKLVADGELRRKMGQAGYEKAQREFDERRVCDIVLNTYKELLKENYANCDSNK